ncbi:TadE/TadG family type IV pilus assembly protein [Nocardioides sp. GXZ039]|uniref:TadE/TadG family type IV pilus assembly protein n=1 Tax=Nocardioides sp. GXZ039 TaxID=3136018 RepID=UPI0030F3BCC3
MVVGGLRRALTRRAQDTTPTFRREDRGAAAVEFAIVVIPLLYLVFGIINYGYMLAFRQSVSQAAAEGARAAAVAPAGLPEADLRQRAAEAVDGALESYDVSCEVTSGLLMHGDEESGTCQITGPVTCSGSTTGAQCMRVELDYTYADDPLLPDVGYGIVLPDHLKFASEVQVS